MNAAKLIDLLMEESPAPNFEEWGRILRQYAPEQALAMLAGSMPEPQREKLLALATGFRSTRIHFMGTLGLPRGWIQVQLQPSGLVAGISPEGEAHT